MGEVDGSDVESARNLREKPLLMRVSGKLYDIALFARKHPGGQRVLKRLAGEDVDLYMTGAKRILGVRHEHSAAAFRMLEKYSVERCVEVSSQPVDDAAELRHALNECAFTGFFSCMDSSVCSCHSN
ncbi:unnamed protein product [Gongylonema pulchrum]|uniref:Cytochrome b5 heme-binding domain-containing protein n=1 Tax=Gongylonema pulchrum TaxID=637853 RepID=A0A183EVI5_9BILA|nr:unnamed protein product [Gongylonema pulchrum]